MARRFLMEGRTDLGGAVATAVAAEDPGLHYVAVSREYMGFSFDPVTRRLYFSACVVFGAGFPQVNATGHKIYVSDSFIVDGADGDGAIPPAATFDGEYAKNFYVGYKSIDTDAVTLIDVFDAAATLPNGVHGSDGTSRMSVLSDAEIDQQFKIVDPRTADMWTHMASPNCSLYVFRAADGYKQRLLPFEADGHMEILGLTDDWLLVMGSSDIQRTNGSLYAVPRLTTSDETAVAALLGYFVEAQPTWMATAYWRTALAVDGKLYIFGSARTGTRDYRLFEYEPAASIGSYGGSPAAGGSFNDITPWISSTGPNSNCAAYAYDAESTHNTDRNLRWARHTMLYLPATAELALLSLFAPQNTTSAGTVHNPAAFRLDCTYYDIAGATFDHHEGFVPTGWIKADLTPATDASDADYAIQFVREIDPYREKHAWDFGDDYVSRWLAFTVQPVVAGAFTWSADPAANLTLLARFAFVSGAPPALQRVEIDPSWLPGQAAYAAAIGSDNVVEPSIALTGEFDPTAGSAEFYLPDNGIYDAATDAFWFGGANANSIRINPAMPTYRGAGAPEGSAFVKLFFAFKRLVQASVRIGQPGSGAGLPPGGVVYPAPPPPPPSGPIANATPGPGWTGDPLSGYPGAAAPVTPTTMVGATTNRPMPTAHWFTTPLQSFCDDFTVHLFAGAPNGIASVEFFHENPTTTTVTAPQHNTVVNGALPLAMQYNTFAITLPAAAWCVATKGEGSKQGATLYAKITANPVSGVTIFPRIIGPLRICPRKAVNGLPNDVVILVTPDGKDNGGVTVAAPSNGVVVNTIAQAETLIGTGGTYAGAFNPLVKFVKTATYDIGANLRGWGSIALAPTCYWTLTHAPGVTARIGRASPPSYNAGAHGVNDLNHWYWLMLRGLVEFRGAGIIFDHKNFAGFSTDTGPSRCGPGGAAYWDNQCTHTLIGVAAVTDPTSGLSSPMYNLYWNGGPNPGFGGAPNQSDQDPGVVNTGALCEWVAALAGGGSNSNLAIEHKYRETRGNMGVGQSILVGSYSRGQVTSIFDPGTPDLLTVQGPSGAILAMSGPANARVLTQTDGAGSATINIGFGPGDANYTVAQVVATLASRSGWTAAVGAGAALGWTAKWMDTGGTEGAFSVSVSSPFTLVAKQPVHTEWFHIIGYYTVAGAPRVDNLLWMNNVQRKAARWGSAPVQAEGTGSASINRPDNSYIVNNLFESTTYDGDMSAMTGGSFNTVCNNYHDIQEGWDGHLGGTDGTRWGLNISTHLLGTPALNGTRVDHNLTPAGASTHAIDATNVDLSPSDLANLVVSAAVGDYRPGLSSVIPLRQAVSPEPYDLFGNARDPAGDYPGPVGKAQLAAPVWPF